MAVEVAGSDTSEQELVHASQQGDLRAFRELYDRHVDVLYRFLARSVSHHQAEDLTAETFAKAWAALPKYEDRGLPFGAWLFRIARNQLISHARKDRDVPSEEGFDSVHPSADISALARVDGESLLVALAELPGRQREVLTLRFLHERTVAEAAGEMGMTEQAVRALTYRSLKALREVLGNRVDHA